MSLEARRASVLACAFLMLAVSPIPAEITEHKTQPAENTRLIVGQTVDENGRPFTDAFVQIRLEQQPAAQALSDSNGRFRAEVPAQDAYRITVTSPGRARVETAIQAKEAAAGDPLDLGKVVLEPGRRIRVQVLDPEGNRIEDAEVQADGRWLRQLSDGLYSEHGFSRDAAYEVRIAHEHFEDHREPLPEVNPAKPERSPDLTVVLTPLPSVRGMVVDENGQPVAKASVRARRMAEEDDLEPLSRFSKAYPSMGEKAWETSQEDGTFQLHGREGTWTLKITHDDFAETHLFDVRISDDSPKDLGKITLRRGATLTVRVRNTDSEPVVGAQVGLSYFHGSQRSYRPDRSRRTSPQGEATFDELPRDQQLAIRLQHPDYVTLESPIDWPEDGVVDLTVDRGSWISGLVVDDKGQPIGNVSIFLERLDSNHRVRSRTPHVRSQEDGAFQITSLRAGQYRLKIETQSHSNQALDPFMISEDAPRDDLRIVLDRLVEVQGQVLSPTGHPVAGAEVRFQHTIADSSRGSHPATTNEDGTYRLSNVPVGETRIIATHRDYGLTEVKLEAPFEAESIDLTLKTKQETRLTVQLFTDIESHNFENTRLFINSLEGQRQPWKGRAAKDGHFEIDLLPGDYELIIVSPVLEYYVHPEPVRVTAVPEPSLEIHLTRGASVVIDVHGLEPPELDDVIVMTMAPTSTRGQANSHNARRIGPNRFRMGGLAPGEWTIEARHRWQGAEESRTVQIHSAGEEQHLDLTFAKGSELAGQVFLNGKLADRGRVRMQGLGLSREASIGIDGRFQFNRLAEGTYSVSVSLESQNSLPYGKLEIPGTDTLRIDLQIRHLDGRVLLENRALENRALDNRALDNRALDNRALDNRAPDNRALENSENADQAFLTLQALGEPSRSYDSRITPDGTFFFSSLPADRYLARAVLDGYEPEMVEIDLENRSITDFEIRLRPSESVPIEVRTPDGLTGKLALCQIDSQMRRIHCQQSQAGDVVLTAYSSKTHSLLIIGLFRNEIITTLVDIEDAKRGPVVLQRTGSLQLEIRELVESPRPATFQLISSTGQPFGVLQALARGLKSPRTFPYSPTAIPNIPPGKWRFEVEAEDGKSWRGEVQVSPGETTTVVVE